MPIAAEHNSIAVIDDDPSIGRMLCRVMAAEGLSVQWFKSAEEFLDSPSRGNYACLVLDVNLPGMSGVQLQQQLNDAGIEPHTVFISGQADDTIRQQVLTAGAAGFLNKPFSIDALLECLHQGAIGRNERTIFKP